MFNKNSLTASFISLGISLFAAGTMIAQSPTPTPKVDDDIIRVESRLVVVPTSVTDAAGQPVLGLGLQDFKLSEEGKPQTIDKVGTAENVPLEIALLFDISATTSPMFKFQEETAASFLKNVMRPVDRACVFTIGSRPVLIQPLDTAEKTVAAIQTINAAMESTAFFDSVGMAADYLRKNAPDGTRRVVVVISDGEDTNSERIANAIQAGYRKLGAQIDTIDRDTLYQLTVTNRNNASLAERQRILRLLQNADTVFYSINPAGSSFQLNQISVYGQDNMALFADQTGGTAFLPKFQPIDTKDEYLNANNSRKNADTLNQIFRQLGNDLRSQYLLQFYSEGDFAVGRFVKLDVSAANRPDLHIRSRSGYFVK